MRERRAAFILLSGSLAGTMLAYLQQLPIMRYLGSLSVGLALASGIAGHDSHHARAGSAGLDKTPHNLVPNGAGPVLYYNDTPPVTP